MQLAGKLHCTRWIRDHELLFSVYYWVLVTGFMSTCSCVKVFRVSCILYCFEPLLTIQVLPNAIDSANILASTFAPVAIATTELTFRVEFFGAGISANIRFHTLPSTCCIESTTKPCSASSRRQAAPLCTEKSSLSISYLNVAFSYTISVPSYRRAPGKTSRTALIGWLIVCFDWLTDCCSHWLLVNWIFRTFLCVK